jgi:hypothetical protein
MKLTTVTTMLKSNAVKLLTGAALAGAVLTAAAPAAQAQRVVFGVQLGGPRYYAPAPPVVFGHPGFYGDRHFDGWRDRDDFRFRHDRDDHRDWDRRDFDRRDFDRR